MIRNTRPADLLDAEQMLADARAVIAREMLDIEPPVTGVGDITLHPHQRRAVGRVRALLRVYGGALLADATGLGKTFVALAVARGIERILIVAPASLADAWAGALVRARVTARFMSLERLSRGARSPLDDPELVIIDEAHHLRNPRTKRYAAAAALCDRARVLLLSATPLQNRRTDLIAQLALFLGDKAFSASDADLARLIVRRRPADVAIRLPKICGPQWISLDGTDDLLDDLLAVPPPLPGSDEGEAGALVTYTLLRQWASSRAALVAALRRRLAKAIAMITSLEAGRWPARDELAAWSQAEDLVQLALPDLLAPLGSERVFGVSTMLGAVRAHADGLRALLARLRALPDPDRQRVAALVDICRGHPNARILAFSQYAETVHALSRLLMANASGVAELTARGGRVAGGRLRRRDILAQYSPQGARGEPPAAERIRLLVTTDVLSEGLDLQRASVVVHLDLPWNPARLEQRVGRVRRLGSVHDTIFVYALAPPASSERVLRVEARLRAKLTFASRIVGLSEAILHDHSPVGGLAPPEAASAVADLLEQWRGPLDETSCRGNDCRAFPTCAGILAPNAGLLALLAAGSERLLVAKLEDAEATLSPEVVARVAEMCIGPARRPTDSEIDGALDAIRDWAGRWSARYELGLPSVAGARLRLRVAGRITAFLASAPRHEQVSLAPLASRAQLALRSPLGAGAEHALRVLARAEAVDAQWLSEIAALGDNRGDQRAVSGELVPLALIVLRRRDAGDG
jgi:superfamily II DNA or RNA helicase